MMFTVHIVNTSKHSTFNVSSLFKDSEAKIQKLKGGCCASAGFAVNFEMKEKGVIGHFKV